MDAYVITIANNKKSIEAADRCKKSAAKFGIDVKNFEAYTPEDYNYIINIFININNKLNLDHFGEKWSRYKNAVACFFSHYSLWNHCVYLNRPLLILEHDAIFTSDPKLNELTFDRFDRLLNIGRPSYGKYKIKSNPGIYPSFSKNDGAYLGGAHAYIIKPDAAVELIKQASIKALPTDIFLSNKTFPWIEELYPWPVIADDRFTTVQNEHGIRAKHNYNKNFEVI